MKAAVFGSSFVSRLGRSSEADCRIKYFGVGGMTAEEPNKACLESLLRYAPDRVLIHLGGNDISIHKTPREMADDILRLVSHLEDKGVGTVLVGQILTRGGTFKKSPGMTGDMFQRKKNRVNTILRGKLGKRFILLRMKFPQDFAADEVHISEGNLWKYGAQIRRALLKELH